MVRQTIFCFGNQINLTLILNKDSNKRRYSSIEKFILHLHPVNVDKRAIKFNRTFGLGGICALLLVILFITGMVLRFSYVPTVEYAYDSIVELQKHSVFGQLIRNIHHLSAKFLMVFSFLHLARVYYSQSILKKRAENWIYGLLLMFLIVLSSFTGYLLPWDQLSYWATTVITKIIEYIPVVGVKLAYYVRSGDEVNGNTLLNFYNLHTGILPLAFSVLMILHFWLVRKAGGVALPKSIHKEKVPVIPHLIRKEIMVASIVIASIFLISVFYNAPLLDEANPLKNPDPTKAPWYFLGAQELLLHLHPFFSAVLLPLALVFYFVYLPFFKYKHINRGVWFNSNIGKRLTIQTSYLSAIFTFSLIYLLEHYLHFDIWLNHWPSWIGTGLIPLALYIIPVSLYLIYWGKIKDTHNTELIMALTTIIFSSYITMMFVALLLRGKGMLLMF